MRRNHAFLPPGPGPAVPARFSNRRAPRNVLPVRTIPGVAGPITIGPEFPSVVSPDAMAPSAVDLRSRPNADHGAAAREIHASENGPRAADRAADRDAYAASVAGRAIDRLARDRIATAADPVAVDKARIDRQVRSDAQIAARYSCIPAGNSLPLGPRFTPTDGPDDPRCKSPPLVDLAAHDSGTIRPGPRPDQLGARAASVKGAGRPFGSPEESRLASENAALVALHCVSDPVPSPRPLLRDDRRARGVATSDTIRAMAGALGGQSLRAAQAAIPGLASDLRAVLPTLPAAHATALRSDVFQSVGSGLRRTLAKLL